MSVENATVVFLNTSFSNTTAAYYDPSKDDCTLLAKLTINTIIAGGVCFLGLAGNAFSYVVLRRDKQTPVASFLLQSLAVMDSFFLGLWFIHFSVNDIFEYARLDQYSFKYWIYIRLYSYPFLFIGQTATIWCTVLIALTRYIAICVPYRASQLCNLYQVHKYVAILCGFSVLYNVPRFFDTSVVHVTRNGTEKYFFALADLGQSWLYRLLYLDIAYYIFSFGLPLLILAVLNTRLTIAYRRVQKRRRHLRGGGRGGETNTSGSTTITISSSKSQHHADPNITLVMIIVVLVFMLCNLPARVVQMVSQYQEQACLSPGFIVREFATVLEVLNSSVNFIIYCVFRKQFRDILCRILGCKSAAEASTAAETTMNTVVNGYTMINKDIPQDNGPGQDGGVVTNGNHKDTDC
jgi:hypothetical protein